MCLYLHCALKVRLQALEFELIATLIWDRIRNKLAINWQKFAQLWLQLKLGSRLNVAVKVVGVFFILVYNFLCKIRLFFVSSYKSFFRVPMILLCFETSNSTMMVMVRSIWKKIRWK